MAWTTPITDRTLADIEYAITHQDAVLDLKGAWNISDINRIIDNTDYLKTQLNNYGYFFPYTTLTHLVETDFPFDASFVTVLKTNVISMVDAFYKQGNPTIVINTNPTYTMANSIEINLQSTLDLLTLLPQSFRRCGTFSCGTDFRL